MNGSPPDPGLPIALPAAWSTDGASDQVRPRSVPPRATNTGLVLPPTTVRVGSGRLERLRQSLGERDRAIMRLLRGHRYLTTPQVQAFCFHDHASAGSAARSARRVLRRLANIHLIAALNRRIGGIRAGSASFVWQLAPAGARLLEGGRAFRSHEPSPRFLAHCLAIADVHLSALHLQRSGKLEACAVELEPECWRRFAGLGGERRVLQPDLFIKTVTAEYEDRWFVEVDLGTESLPTLLGKCAVYEAYRACGLEQHDSGVFPLVLWQLPTEARRDLLTTKIARAAFADASPLPPDHA